MKKKIYTRKEFWVVLAVLVVIGYFIPNKNKQVTTDKVKTNISKVTKPSTSTIKSSEKTKDNTETSKKDISWYAKDSKYATLEPVSNTVKKQMEEIGTNDPIFAISVNVIQTILSSNGNEYDSKNVAKNTSYNRHGLKIEIKYNNEETNSDTSKKISDELYNITGLYYTINGTMY
ncbi:hypothetical protein SAMN02745116_02531 [Pilibacter termitis]|uniref:Uncharacterized protein n=1 Tax=Pilibacter termitis TaxID=263852 RepID=A0A1T4RC95_9ENTE|nr:hypothetical protein [Pilibacter termitis]SKA13539.1 hypothetical protein SAMN02745116_02531 [Pilibacter termitis]